MSETALCTIHDIDEEESKGFVIERNGESQSIFGVKKDGILTFFENNCPHLGVPLDFNPDQFLDVEKNFVICSTHGALFKLDDGECVHGPCLGKFLTPVPFEIVGDDIFVK